MFPSHFLTDTATLYKETFVDEVSTWIVYKTNVHCRVIALNTISGFASMRIEGLQEKAREQYRIAVQPDIDLTGVGQIAVAGKTFRVLGVSQELTDSNEYFTTMIVEL